MRRVRAVRGNVARVAIVAAAMLAAGCQSAPTTIFASAPRGERTLDVTVTDETGLVHDVAFLQAPLAGESSWEQLAVGGVGGRPEAVQLGWMDGVCPSPVGLRVTNAANRIRIELRWGQVPMPDDPDCGWTVAVVRTATILFKIPIDPAAVIGVDADQS